MWQETCHIIDWHKRAASVCTRCVNLLAVECSAGEYLYWCRAAHCVCFYCLLLVCLMWDCNQKLVLVPFPRPQWFTSRKCKRARETRIYKLGAVGARQPTTTRECFGGAKIQQPIIDQFRDRASSPERIQRRTSKQPEGSGGVVLIESKIESTCPEQTCSNCSLCSALRKWRISARSVGRSVGCCCSRGTAGGFNKKDENDCSAC